jgi:hypothetical protein
MENLQDACLCVHRPLESKGGTFYEIRINIDLVNKQINISEILVLFIKHHKITYSL